jgi:hypothetical protein
MRTISFFLLLAASFVACQSPKSPAARPLSADEVVNRSLEAMGARLLDSVAVSFDFRGKMYLQEKWGNAFTYHRASRDSLGNETHDVMHGDSLIRTLNGEAVPLTEKEADIHYHAINSVMYFAFLPYKLNDPAAKREWIGDATVKGIPYHKVRVTFSPEGGGKDHDDEFVYWFRTDDYQLGYLAYRYHTNEGGVRFREAFNQRNVGGLVIRDYRNYKHSQPDSVEVKDLDKLWEAGKLELLSDVLLENVEVKRP